MPSITSLPPWRTGSYVPHVATPLYACRLGFSLWCIIGVSCAVSGISTSTVLLAAEHRNVATSKRAPLCRQETLQLACTRACFVSRPCQRSGRKTIDISCSSIASPRFHTPHQTAVTAAGHRLVVATHGASKEVPFHCSGPSSRFLLLS